TNGHLSRALWDASGATARHRLIKQIERLTRRRLITYVSSFTQEGMIVPDDQTPVVDLLSDARPEEPIDLLINSPGGLPDATETLIRNAFRATNRPFRVIVASSAKSAATLLALGADEIVMGFTSQLGPIDPQVWSPRAGMMLPARAVLQAYKSLTQPAQLSPGA
ncbi:periplasmic serine protease, partial [mine drainage metagenome]